MRIFKGRDFAKFAAKNGLEDDQLCATVAAMERGLVDADLGGQVYKQRIARRGSGKSGGFRTILLLRWRSLAIYIHGYAKSDKANITFAEVAVYRAIAKNLLVNETLLAGAIKGGQLIEVKCDGETTQD